MDMTPNGEVRYKERHRRRGWSEKRPVPARITAKIITIEYCVRFDRGTGRDRSAWYSGRPERSAIAYRIGDGEWVMIAASQEED